MRASASSLPLTWAAGSAPERVNVQMTANIIALRSILHAIETNVPYLFVDTLSVRSQVPGNYKPVPGGEPAMFVQMDVSGYVIPPAP